MAAYWTELNCCILTLQASHPHAVLDPRALYGPREPGSLWVFIHLVLCFELLSSIQTACDMPCCLWALLNDGQSFKFTVIS